MSQIIFCITRNSKPNIVCWYVRVERKHQHILTVARSLRFQASLSIKFWGDCVLTAAHLINRTPSSVLDGYTPYEMLFIKKPLYASLRIFGCLCYAHKGTRQRDKLDERSTRCVFLGYLHCKKGWRVYNLDSNEYFVSRDVVFNEEVFSFASIVTRVLRCQVMHLLFL